MAHTKNLQRLGNSLALIIDKSIADMLDLTAETPVKLDVDSLAKKLIVTPVTRMRPEVRMIADAVLAKRHGLYRRLAEHDRGK